MSTSDTQPRRQYETRLTEEERRYLLRSHADVVQILRQVLERNAMITASFGDGSDFALTTLLDLDPDEDDAIVLDMPGQREIIPALLASDVVTLITQLDGIKIKFQVDGVSRTSFEDRDALAASLPDGVVRLQRREFFRVVCPLANPPHLSVPYAVLGEARRGDFDVIDVSQGGLAVMARHGEIDFQVGNDYPECTLTLPGEAPFVTTLEVRNVRDVELRSGRALRVGFRFIRPPADGITRLQRYTMRIERERKAKFE